MKTLKKIKLIENGRFSTSEEMSNIKGACNYSGCNKYSSCGLISLVSCNPGAAYGYETHGGGSSCASGYTYSSCCSLFSKYFSCGGTISY